MSAFLGLLLAMATLPYAGATCFLEPGVDIPGCTCHPSCGTCGYTPDPTSEVDCVTCADPLLSVLPVFPDLTGVCRDLSDPSVVAATAAATCQIALTWDTLLPIPSLDPACACASTCGPAGCGYYDCPSTPVDCIDCAPGLILREIFEDGTGFCQDPSVPVLDNQGESLCLAQKVDGSVEPILPCDCDPSCKVCGYAQEFVEVVQNFVNGQFISVNITVLGEPPTAPTQCIVCADGGTLLSLDGETGICIHEDAGYDDIEHGTEFCKLGLKNACGDVCCDAECPVCGGCDVDCAAMSQLYGANCCPEAIRDDAIQCITAWQTGCVLDAPPCPDGGCP